MADKLIVMYKNQEDFDPILERINYLVMFCEMLDESNPLIDQFYLKLLEARMYWEYNLGTYYNKNSTEGEPNEGDA